MKKKNEKEDGQWARRATAIFALMIFSSLGSSLQPAEGFLCGSKDSETIDDDVKSGPGLKTGNI